MAMQLLCMLIFPTRGSSWLPLVYNTFVACKEANRNLIPLVPTSSMCYTASNCSQGLYPEEPNCTMRCKYVPVSTHTFHGACLCPLQCHLHHLYPWLLGKLARSERPDSPDVRDPF